jgi:hypothetical protein
LRPQPATRRLYSQRYDQNHHEDDPFHNLGFKLAAGAIAITGVSTFSFDFSFFYFYFYFDFFDSSSPIIPCLLGTSSMFSIF